MPNVARSGAVSAAVIHLARRLRRGTLTGRRQGGHRLCTGWDRHVSRDVAEALRREARPGPERALSQVTVISVRVPARRCQVRRPSHVTSMIAEFDTSVELFRSHEADDRSRCENPAPLTRSFFSSQGKMAGVVGIYAMLLMCIRPVLPL